MNKLITLIVLSCVTLIISAQQYVSFDREIMSPINNFSINDWLLKEINNNVSTRRVTSSLLVTNASKLSGVEHSKYQVLYGSFPIDFCSVNVHTKDGIILSINGNIAAIDNFDSIPSITPHEALQIAIKYVHAKTCSWQAKPPFLTEHDDTQYLLREPVPKLVICPNFKNDTKIPTLTYKVELFSIDPFDHQYIYISAKNGDVVHVQPLMHEINGTAYTRYSGTRTISTSYSGNLYRLYDSSRGNGIYTYALYYYNNSYLLTDNDNIWTYSEYHSSKQDAALDAHWGAMKTYDFFKDNYNRYSIDDNGLAIRNYVNYPGIGDNAYWNSNTQSMYYGTGDIIFDAVTSLDVIAHELGHGITRSFQNNMLYEGETGAINESISDIWGACVEYYAAPNKQCWRIGEDITLTAPALRYMDNPKLGGDPDTYWGTYYLDPATNSSSAVVHHNSGVPNHWFYLLSSGGTGTNDNGYSYSVEGIGIDAAADIVYETLYYLQNEMTFANFAAKTRTAAINLYGICAEETINLIEAWKAVGVPVEDLYETLNITETLQTGYSRRYFANGLVTASNVVQNGATEILESATRIILASGFCAELGATVTANIVPCADSNTRNMLHIPSGTKYTADSSHKLYDDGYSNIHVSPNPAVDEIVIIGIDDECKYLIYDMMGKVVKVGQLHSPYNINVAQLLQGQYVLKITTDIGYLYVKFIKK